jgi:hypothetical protein
MLDRSTEAPSVQPIANEERTRFPAYPWDLRTVIIVFPQHSPFRFLNLNVLLGMTGVPFDQVEQWGGSDPKDAFDLQFCLEAKHRCATYKQYHSVSRELRYRPDDVYFELGERILFEGRWPTYHIRYRQPEINLELSIQLDSWTGFHWWAYSPGIYCHYTSFCDCRFEWQWKDDEGILELPALHDHGWGKNLLPLRLPLRVFRYEVLRFPKGAFALSLWTEAPCKMELKNVGLIRWDRQPAHSMKRYECRVLEWDRFHNYAGRQCRVPRRWIGAQYGDAAEFHYEAIRNSEPRAVLGEGFLYGFDYQGRLTSAAASFEKIEGSGYVEQLGRFPR